MIYNLESEVEINLDFDYEKTFHDVVDCVVDLFECEYDCEVNLLLVNNESIREINNDTRGIDNPTDVLSFPNLDFIEAGSFNDIDETDDIFEPDSGELILGDIVISLEKVHEQALQFGHSERREFAFLIAHSMLHLIGFDHMEDTEREEMEEYQRKIMDILKIGR